jgi:hypothetical protein
VLIRSEHEIERDSALFITTTTPSTPSTSELHHGHRPRRLSSFFLHLLCAFLASSFGPVSDSVQHAAYLPAERAVSATFQHIEDRSLYGCHTGQRTSQGQA